VALQTIRAARDASAGAINSPAILMRSGIGPRAIGTLGTPPGSL
jgi:choline dehydrogenase-like flavoprotein